MHYSLVRQSLDSLGCFFMLLPWHLMKWKSPKEKSMFFFFFFPRSNGNLVTTAVCSVCVSPLMLPSVHFGRRHQLTRNIKCLCIKGLQSYSLCAFTSQAVDIHRQIDGSHCPLTVQITLVIFYSFFLTYMYSEFSSSVCFCIYCTFIFAATDVRKEIRLKL